MIALTLVLAAITPIATEDWARTVTEEGHCLRWEDVATLTLHGSAGEEDRTAALEASISAWNAGLARCASVRLEAGAPVSGGTVGYRLDAPNENVVVTRDHACAPGGEGACWDHGASVIALTTSTFRRSTGVLLDADIELNAADFMLTTVDAPACAFHAPRADCVATDVQNALSHELGHVLGLAHVEAETSVMRSTTGLGDVSRRVVDDGSISGVCASHPATAPSLDCVEATHTSPAALVEEDPWGCSTGAAWGTTLVGLLGRRRRSRERKR